MRENPKARADNRTAVEFPSAQFGWEKEELYFENNSILYNNI